MYYIIRSIPVDQSHRIVGIMKKKKQKAELSGQFIVNPYPELRPFSFGSLGRLVAIICLELWL